MGTGHSSHNNLRSDCTSFDVTHDGATARWRNSLEVSMCNWRKGNTEFWGMEYKTNQKKREKCSHFELWATHDQYGVRDVTFGFGDYASNIAEIALNITRDGGRDDLRVGITSMHVDSSNQQRFLSTTEQGHTIETRVVPYICPYRTGVFVLEMRKKGKAVNACMVTMAHYYVTDDDVGLYVVAKISHKMGHGFVVEVDGPFKRSGVDLDEVISLTFHTRVWSPDAFSHSNGANRSHGEETRDQIVNTFLQRNNGVQYNTGLINSSGSTTGNLNNSIVVLNFPRYRN